MNHFFPQPADAQEAALFDRITQWQGGPANLSAFTPDFIRDLTAREGCDFATALLHRRIVTSEEHGPFLRERLGRGSLAPAPGLLLGIVPGAFYRENPRTGADGRLALEAAAQLGLPAEVIPTSSTGRLAENAEIIATWLLARQERSCALVSVSKGSSDLKAAFARPDANRIFRRTVAWINLCGILDGTPMADWLFSPGWLARANRFVYRIRGHSLDFLEDLRRFPGCPLDFPLILPHGLRAIHVLGFPLKRHLYNGLVRRCHTRVEAYGPNDGSIILADALRWPGQLCPVWAADHHLRPPGGARPLLEAIFKAVCSVSDSGPSQDK